METISLKFALFVALILPSLATGAQLSNAIPDPCLRYEFSWKAEPAFMPESTLAIEADGGIARATITYSQRPYEPSRSEELTLTNAASKTFCAALLRLIAMRQPGDHRRVLDGIYIEGDFTAGNTAPYYFSFQSPNRIETPRDFKITDAVFAVFERTTVSCELNVYLERLSEYFQFGLPVRVIAEEPLTLRWHGSFSINEHQEIQTLLSKLSKRTSIRIDVSNFSGMGRMYYPDFRRLISEVPDISWTASENSARMLAEIGVKPEKIRIVEGPSCKSERVRFARR
jgi:hypothetical protein